MDAAGQITIFPESRIPEAGQSTDWLMGDLLPANSDSRTPMEKAPLPLPDHIAHSVQFLDSRRHAKMLSPNIYDA